MILNPPSIVKLYKSVAILINNPSTEHFLANIFRAEAKPEGSETNILAWTFFFPSFF